jgi:hypothetical protein
MILTLQADSMLQGTRPCRPEVVSSDPEGGCDGCFYYIFIEAALNLDKRLHFLPHYLPQENKNYLNHAYNAIYHEVWHWPSRYGKLRIPCRKKEHRTSYFSRRSNYFVRLFSP